MCKLRNKTNELTVELKERRLVRSFDSRSLKPRNFKNFEKKVNYYFFKFVEINLYLIY